MNTPGINPFPSASHRPHGIDSAEDNPLAQQYEHADEVRDKTEIALYEDINDARLAKIAAKSILESSASVKLDFESTGNSGELIQAPVDESSNPVSINKLAATLAGSDKYISI